MYLGRLAQSAERFPYKEEVTGSNPVAPTEILEISQFNSNH